MMKEYDAKGQNVLILSYDLGPSREPNPDIGHRKARWFESWGEGTRATLPLVMSQSGNEVAQGRYVDFRKKYTDMIEAAAKQPVFATISASFSHKGKGLYQVEVEIKNTSNFYFDTETNQASLRLFAFEETRVVHLDKTARAVDWIRFPKPLPPQGVARFITEMTVEGTESNFEKMKFLALVEYKDKQGRWNIAQGIIATKLDDPNTTEVFLSQTLLN